MNESCDTPVESVYTWLPAEKRSPHYYVCTLPELYAYAIEHDVDWPDGWEKPDANDRAVLRAKFKSACAKWEDEVAKRLVKPSDTPNRKEAPMSTEQCPACGEQATYRLTAHKRHMIKRCIECGNETRTQRADDPGALVSTRRARRAAWFLTRMGARLGWWSLRHPHIAAFYAWLGYRAVTNPEKLIAVGKFVARLCFS